MRIQPRLILVISFAAFLVGSSMILVSNASSSTQGYVAYQVTLHEGTNQTSFVLNESSVSTSQNGFVKLSFAMTSTMRNLSYSHVINASSLPEIFPFVPAAIAGQSFSYQTHGISVNANITADGSAPISFGGSNYVGLKYLLDLSASNSSSGNSIAVSGTVVTLPSDLLYSVQLLSARNSGTSVSVQLISTNLQLDPKSSGSTVQVAAIAGAGALGAAAFAIPYWKLRQRRKTADSTQDPSDNKPPYWVD